MRARDRFRSVTGAEPGVDELAVLAGKLPRVTQQVLEWAAGGYTFSSADNPMRGLDGGPSTAAWIDAQVDPGPCPEAEAGRAVADVVGAAIDQLPAEQRDVIRAHRDYGGTLTAREIARRTGRTRSQVAALAEAAAATLRGKLTETGVARV